jgi:hypothetical protein
MSLNNVINTKEIERKAFLTYHKDGILDIYLGFSIITLSFLFLAEARTMMGAFSGILVLFPIFYRESKKSYTFPRLGYVKFSGKKGRSRNSFLILFGLLTLSLIGGLGAFYLGNIGDYLWVEAVKANWFWFLSLLSLGLFMLFGYITDLRRLYYYGLVSFILFASGNYIPIDGFWLILILGGVVMATGLILLQRFVHEYPLKSSVRDD